MLVIREQISILQKINEEYQCIAVTYKTKTYKYKYTQKTIEKRAIKKMKYIHKIYENNAISPIITKIRIFDRNGILIFTTNTKLI